VKSEASIKHGGNHGNLEKGMLSGVKGGAVVSSDLSSKSLTRNIYLKKKENFRMIHTNQYLESNIMFLKFFATTCFSKM
jgi:hypothetical protein